MSSLTDGKSGDNSPLDLDVSEQTETNSDDLMEGIARLERIHKELLTLEWLLTGVRPDTFDTEEDREWMNMRPVGDELL